MFKATSFTEWAADDANLWSEMNEADSPLTELLIKLIFSERLTLKRKQKNELII